MKVLLAGNLGYVGPVVARHLHDAHPKATLIGFDSGFFALAPGRYSDRYVDRQVFGDVRNVPPSLLDGVDAVVLTAT